MTASTTVFDIGMYDGADTRYYLESGFRVVAVEANPNLVDRAKNTFSAACQSGHLILVNAAVWDRSDTSISLNISGDDLGASSVVDAFAKDRNITAHHSVACVTITDLIERFGRPHFIKVDIEGADRHCILPLTSDNRPDYLSFEVGADMRELLAHLVSIGFSAFKAVNQRSFLEMSRERNLVDRAKRKVIHALGYDKPEMVRRDRRWFRLGHSAGPLPWCSDGHWHSHEDLLRQWQAVVARGPLQGWYDVQAK